MIWSVRLASAMSLWCIRVRKEEAERDDGAKREKGNYVFHKFRDTEGGWAMAFTRRSFSPIRDVPALEAGEHVFSFFFFFLSNGLLLTGFPRNCLLSGRLIWFKNVKKKRILMSHIIADLSTRLQCNRAKFSTTEQTWYRIKKKKQGYICNWTVLQWFSSVLL